MSSLRTRARAVPIAAVLSALALLLTACVGSSAAPASAGGGATLHLVGFSVAKEFSSALEKGWGATPQGKGVTWQESYGASGDQSRSVANGLSADVVVFSLAPDMTRLVKAGLVADTWNTGPTKGIVADSVVVIVVRSGNPKHIRGWADLVKPGVKIVTPNPASSGSARWNILAAYQQVISSGGTPAQAKAYLTQFFTHVEALPGSGRDATNAFIDGDADALISYENEAILARQSGTRFDYVVPSDTVLIQNPAAVTSKANPKAKAYLDYAFSAHGQRILASKGSRPALPGTSVGQVQGALDPAHPFPQPARLTTIASLGGWTAVNATFFDDATGLVPQIQKLTGTSQ